MSADTTAAKELRGYLERIERLESVRKDAADDIAEVYKELASRGFDKVAAKVIVKIRRADGGLEKWTGTSETVDFYLSALGMLPPAIDARAPAHARVENNDEFPPRGGVFMHDVCIDPETGEITDTQEQPGSPASPSANADTVVASEYAGTSADENPATNSNPVANVGEGANGAIAVASVDPASRDADGADRQQPAVSGFTGGDDGRDVEASGGAASVITIPPSAVTPPAADKTGAAPLPSSAAPVEISDEDVPAFLRKQSKPLRPHCLNPDLCGGSGSKHCYSCLKARDDATVAA